MEKNEGALPPGYMTVGELAQRMHVTVRTLQYYDRKGLLTPSTLSSGGRRLYTDADVVRLHQILSLKQLGFSLDEIRDRLIPLESSDDVAAILAEQAETVRDKIDRLEQSLAALEALRAEVLAMRSVDFSRYADIIMNLQMGNDMYWVIKHMDADMLGRARTRFDRESGEAFLTRFRSLLDEAERLENSGVTPHSDAAVEFARAYWDMILEFADGDPATIPALLELGQSDDMNREGRARSQVMASEFVQAALGAYFERAGIDPFGGGEEA